MHGFFFFGPFFALIGIVSEVIKRRIPLPYEWNESGRLTDEEFGRLNLIFLLVSAACFINPQGVEGALYPVKVFFSLGGENQIFFNYIEELKTPFQPGAIMELGPFMHYKLMIVLSFITFVFNRRRIDISALFLWVIFLIFSLKAIRNLPYFAFAAYLVMITNMLNVSYENIVPIRFIHKKFEYITLIVFKFLIVLWVLNFMTTVAGRQYYDFDKYEFKSEFGGVSQRSFPLKGAQFLIDNNISGNFFNDFNSGAFLIGKVFPQIKVFIDGRTEVYGGAFFKNYKRIWDKGDSALFEEAVKKYNLSGVFLNSIKQFLKKPFITYLYDHPDWIMVYFDYDAVIFLKNTEANKNIIQKHAIDLSQWEVKELDLLRIGPDKVDPYHGYYRAYTLETLDFDNAAMQELDAVFKILPHFGSAHKLYGKIYGKQNNHKKAFQHFRLANILEPSEKENWYNLGLTYYKLGDYERARKIYEKTTYLWPNNAKALFWIAQLDALEKKYDRVLGNIQRAYQAEPRAQIDIMKIGDIVFDDGQFDLARQIYDVARLANDQNYQVYEKYGDIEVAKGALNQALEYYEQALSLSKDNEAIQEKIDNIKNQNPPHQP